LTARIDELLLQLAGTDDAADRKRLAAELKRLNRQKVLAPRPGWNPDEWIPIPVLEYTLRPEAAQGEQLKQAVKAFFWMIVAGLGEPGQPAKRQFVTLLRLVRNEKRGVTFHLVCPFQEPLQYAAAARPGDAAAAEWMQRVAGFEVQHKYAVLEDCLVPVVVDYDRPARTAALENRNHLSNPVQFISPWLCRTTSGFLNSIGAQALEGLQGPKPMVVSNLEALMNQGLDEWFRWFYCLTETGGRFEAKRLLVRKANPEEWAYDYDGD
jgi:hypothetical protein